MSNPAGAEGTRGYVICTTQRAGSNYLCQLLASTGVLGKPLDYFNTQGRRNRGWPDYPADPEQQLEIIRRHGATANGVYGLKLFAYDCRALGALPWTTRLPGLRWIFLHRADLLGQALSLLTAKQTGRWRSTDGAGAPPAYDAAAIDREMRDIARDNEQWRLYFARNGIEPLVLSYENLAAAPDQVVQAIAALMAIDAATVDPAQVDLRVQRDASSQAWRTRYLAERRDVVMQPGPEAPPGTARVWYPALRKARPKLTVSIITRDAEKRLPRLLAEASEYADQILVGVDASSTDGTFDLASSHADTVYQFRLRQPGQLAPARMLALRYATGDWILSLDDDEGMEPSFDALLPALMSAEGVTHHHFPRKWVVSENPGEYLHASPWYPNWARRMFRNDRSLVWKPAQPHSQYYVQGPGHYEYGTSILHFEPVLTTQDARRGKIMDYRTAGADPTSEQFYDYSSSVRRRRVGLRAPTALIPRADRVIDRAVHELEAAARPPWGSAVLSTDLPATARAGASLLVEVKVRNTGVLAWSPSYARWPTREWPLIRLSLHLRHADGSTVEPGANRTLIDRYVAPGDEVTLVHEFAVPEQPGRYTVEWDMLNEYECWFADCGGAVFRNVLLVI